MTLAEWLILAGVVTSIGGVFAVPFGIWMFKISSGLQILRNDLKNMDKRLDRVETDKHTVHEALFAGLKIVGDRLGEHGERLANHEARLDGMESK